jgi:hypothetical protein
LMSGVEGKKIIKIPGCSWTQLVWCVTQLM